MPVCTLLLLKLLFCRQRSVKCAVAVLLCHLKISLMAWGVSALMEELAKVSKFQQNFMYENWYNISCSFVIGLLSSSLNYRPTLDFGLIQWIGIILFQLCQVGMPTGPHSLPPVRKWQRETSSLWTRLRCSPDSQQHRSSSSTGPLTTSGRKMTQREWPLKAHSSLMMRWSLEYQQGRYIQRCLPLIWDCLCYEINIFIRSYDYNCD